MSTTYPTLYKRTSAGKIQIWFAEIDQDRYRTTSGQEDGKKTVAAWTTAKPKNVGRSNELTAEQQAIAEVEAMYTKQRKKDYKDSRSDVDTITRIKPMLAEKWEDRKRFIVEEYSDKHVTIDAKLDGMRCIATLQGLYSREGNPILGVPHIHEHLKKKYFNHMPDLIIDGELYNHDYKDDFNSIISCTKKTKTITPETLKRAEEVIQYWVYDIPSMFEQTTVHRKAFIREKIEVDQFIKHAPSGSYHFGQVDEVSMNFIEEGYEGAMVRLETKYEFKRSKGLIKWKEFQDEEFEIVDIIDGEGKHEGIAATVIFKLPDGRTSKAGIKGNRAFCKKLFEERAYHIGKMATIIFQNYTPDGKPRFAKYKATRDYE